MPRTAVSTPLIRDAQRTAAAPGPATTTLAASSTDGRAWASHVMNNAKPSTPACQDRPDRAHQRRNNAIECAYAFVVDSAASRPNRRCRRYPSATPTTCRSLSSTVQYRCPDGKLTGNARMVSRFRVDSHKRLPATSTTPPEKRRTTSPIMQIEHVPQQLRKPRRRPADRRSAEPASPRHRPAQRPAADQGREVARTARPGAPIHDSRPHAVHRASCPDGHTPRPPRPDLRDQQGDRIRLCVIPVLVQATPGRCWARSARQSTPPSARPETLGGRRGYAPCRVVLPGGGRVGSVFVRIIPAVAVTAPASRASRSGRARAGSQRCWALARIGEESLVCSFHYRM